ncbi:MAG TPA: hypothetical protein IAB72_00090 [Candidatus Onthoplasma faecipullorum]|nr:hypothetical protein [Candidatus Onthoplasma faecipullorum]
MSKKVKMLFIGAIVIIALLLITVIAQIIAIYQKQQTNLAQQEEIARLENEKNYYENQQGDNSDDKGSDSEIIVGENQ